MRPDPATSLGQIEHFTRWLAGDQRLAEVAYRGPQRGSGAFENTDLEAAPGSGVGMGKAQIAGADNQ
ncbi:hypothetical protein D3C72_2172600 [compost metagenome]